jgi:4-amino-4-deoxy-L-arabinose transferase-like glycosyltransferase
MPAPDQPTKSRQLVAITALAVIAVCSVLFLYRLADRDLWSSHEGRAAMDSQTLLDQGANGLPRLFDGQPELQKPPLYYWLVAGLAWLHGSQVDEWDVRLPAALSALACTAAVFVLLGLRRRPWAGLIAAMILATAIHFVWLARIGRIDMPLTLAVTAAAGSWYLAQRRHRHGRSNRAFLLAGYLAVAVGVLLKGPIGALLPVSIWLAHLLLAGYRLPGHWLSAARQLGLIWGGPLVLLLTVPYYWRLHSATVGEFTRVFFWHHNFGRGLGGTGLRSNPWWFYVPQFGVDFLPWSVLLPLAIWWCWRRRWLARDSDARFGLAWLLGVFLFLSCSRFKRADYLLPAYPGAALFLGCVLRRQIRALRNRSRLFLQVLIPVVALLVSIGWVGRVQWMLPGQESYRDYRAFARIIRERAPAPQAVVFFQTEAHALAFHVGRPQQVLVQWEELLERLDLGRGAYIILRPELVAQCHKHLVGFRVEELSRSTNLSGGQHERPLVLLRVESVKGHSEDRISLLSNATISAAAADRDSTVEPGSPGP